MAAGRVVLTYKDYEALPNDGKRYEIHDGELSVTPAPGTRHQRTLGRLNDAVRRHVEANGLGEVFFAPVDCILADTTIVQPDLVYLDATRSSLVSERGIEGPPTLVVEVLSPGTTRIDRTTKLQLYARYAVPYYWIADSEARVIEAYRLAGSAYELVARAAGGPAAALPPFPELALVADSIFPA